MPELPILHELKKLTDATAYLRMKVTKQVKCQFFYSLDGNKFMNAGNEFTTEVGRWEGAKLGIFCVRESQTNDSGFKDVDWFRVEKAE